MAEENNLSLDTEKCDDELSDSENNVKGGLQNESLTESNILQTDNRNSKSNPIDTVSGKDHYNLNVKDTKLNKTEENEKEIDFLIKSLKEDSCAECSGDSSELLQSKEKQKKAIEDEVESETIISENDYNNFGINQTIIKDKIEKRQDGTEECFKNNECTGSSDFSLEESVDRNNKMKSLSDEHHGSSESINFTTVHSNKSMYSSTIIETNKGAQICENRCSLAKFSDESSRPLKYNGCQHVTVSEAARIKPLETPLFSTFFFKRDADQFTNRRNSRRKKSSKVLDQQQLHVVQSPDDFIYCCTHNEVVKYWCHTCGVLKCEKCVNFVYSRTCISHVVTTIEEHVIRTKEIQRQNVEKKSNICLRTLDQAIRVLQRNEQQTELQALIKKDRIRQEFASFYHLLIEEERTVLNNIDTSLDEYRTQNRSSEQLYGSVVEYEADLMSKSLSLMEKDDPFGINLNKGDIIINKNWFKLQDMTKEVLNSIPPMPTTIRDKFTLYKQKLDTLKHLSTVEHPIEVSPVSFTLYINGNEMTTPIKLSKLFICKNSKYSFPELVLDVEIRWGPRIRQEIYKGQLKINDYIFNIDEKPHFCEFGRYLVKARPLLINTDEQYSQNENRLRWRNILVVTGYHPLSLRQRFEEALAYMENLRKQLTGKHPISFRTSDQSQEFLKWTESKMWLLSSHSKFKDFFDVSPEEMRVLAYRTDKATYNLFHSLFVREVLGACVQAEHRRNWEFLHNL